MSEPMVAYHNGSWACYTTPDGIRRRYVGCSHRLPRAAIAHRQNLDPFVSPLATPSEEPRQPVSPAERDTTRARNRVASAGALRGAPQAVAGVTTTAPGGAPMPLRDRAVARPR